MASTWYGSLTQQLYVESAAYRTCFAVVAVVVAVVAALVQYATIRAGGHSLFYVMALSAAVFILMVAAFVAIAPAAAALRMGLFLVFAAALPVVVLLVDLAVLRPRLDCMHALGPTLRVLCCNVRAPRRTLAGFAHAVSAALLLADCVLVYVVLYTASLLVPDSVVDAQGPAFTGALEAVLGIAGIASLVFVLAGVSEAVAAVVAPAVVEYQDACSRNLLRTRYAQSASGGVYSYEVSSESL